MNQKPEGYTEDQIPPGKDNRITYLLLQLYPQKLTIRRMFRQRALPQDSIGLVEAIVDKGRFRELVCVHFIRSERKRGRGSESDRSVVEEERLMKSRRLAARLHSNFPSFFI
jgi:hypothetical protein